MAVPTKFSDLSTTASSNPPGGSENAAGQVDDYLRGYGALIRAPQAYRLGVASASTVDLSTYTEGYIQITGTATIVSLGSDVAGIEKDLVFSGAATLTHSSNLILPGSVTTTVTAGDVWRFRSEGSGTWRCVGVLRSSGNVLTPSGAVSAPAISSLYDTTTGWYWPAVGTGAYSVSGTQALRIDPTARVLFGTSSTAPNGTGTDAVVGMSFVPGASSALVHQNNSNANVYLAKVSGYSNNVFASLYVNGTAVGTITTDGTGVAYNTTSDERLKEDWRPLDPSVVDRIEVGSFAWKATGSRSAGVKAQQIAGLVPDAVAVGDDGPEVVKAWQVDYSKIVPFLIAKCQDLQKQLDALKGA